MKWDNSKMTQLYIMKETLYMIGIKNSIDLIRIDLERINPEIIDLENIDFIYFKFKKITTECCLKL